MIKKFQVFCEGLSGKFSSAIYFIRTHRNFKNVLVLQEQSAQFLFEFEVENSNFWEIKNIAICHISVALNIYFNREKGFRDTKNCQNCKLQGFWGE